MNEKIINQEKKELIIGFVVKEKKGGFKIIFPKMKRKKMQELKKAINERGAIKKMSNNKVVIIPQNSCCPHTVSDLAYHIGEIISGIVVDAQTIPVEPEEIFL